MNDSRDFQDAETVRSGQSHVPSQPASLPTSSSSWWNAKPFFWIAEPQRRAAKYLGHTWCIGNRYCKSNGVFFSTLSARFEPVDLQCIRTHITTCDEVKAKHQFRNRDASQGPSARNSVIPSEGRFFKNYGADQQRLQISDPHFDKFPTPATFACWKTRFKTEVCACSQIPTEALLWIKKWRWLFSG